MNILDEINERLKRLEAKLDAQAKPEATPAAPATKSGFMSARELCLTYSISRFTLQRWLDKMSAEGFSVEVRRTSPRAARRFNAEHFARAFAAVIKRDEKEVAA